MTYKSGFNNYLNKFKNNFDIFFKEVFFIRVDKSELSNIYRIDRTRAYQTHCSIVSWDVENAAPPNWMMII